jgi:hypothetical protein
LTKGKLEWCMLPIIDSMISLCIPALLLLLWAG